MQDTKRFISNHPISHSQEVKLLSLHKLYVNVSYIIYLRVLLKRLNRKIIRIFVNRFFFGLREKNIFYYWMLIDS